MESDDVSVLLLRHLPTEKNLSKIYIGQIDDPIVNGSIIDYADWCFGPRIAVVYSPLLRCLQTVTLFVQDMLRVNGRRLTMHLSPNDLLVERGMGDFQGKRKARIKKRYSDKVVKGMFDPFFVPPNGEAFDVFHERVNAFYHQLLTLREESVDQVVVCSHVHVFRLLTCIHYELDIQEHWYDMRFPYGSITQLM